VYPYKEYHPTIQRKEKIIQARWMSLENTIVNESTQPKKIVYCMNPFI
jgi:hypothetical protein